ncbi:MAG: ATP-binding cassette domain-containing protein [Deltaproteobacteria bacterium]
MTLTFDAVTFAYGWLKPPVLQAFDWSVPEGRTVLLGPNGAGKSTLLSLGADALRPRRGRVRYGATSSPNERRRKVGWMPQHVRPFPGLTVREQVAYAGWLKGLAQSTAWTEAAGALELVGLGDLQDRRAATLSGGQLRRLGIAQTLVHQAEVLLLDEPTAGLDPAQRARFRTVLTSLPQSSRIVVSTHQVDDLSDVYHHVVVLCEGTIRFQGAVDAFLAIASAGDRRAERAYAAVMDVVA